MPRPKTTWEDLSTLGWFKQQVYETLNAQRGHTMRGADDLALNGGFAEKWGWYCYNDVKGGVRYGEPVYSDSSKESVAWSYTNLTEAPFVDTWTETWTEEQTTSVSITKHASITLNAGLNIKDVFNLGIDFSVSTESTEAKTDNKSYQLSHTWEISVGPGETVELLRDQVTTVGTQYFSADYGLADYPGDMIGTDGKQYDGHYYWGYSANHYLNNPHGTMTLSGSLKKVQYNFKLQRVAPGGKSTIEPVGGPTHATLRSGAGEDAVKVVFAVPAGDKAGE
ncbi:cytolysin [Fomitopsis serialis]|uniref:cytolysin n=1 Tax=Fomitopsis serialis TaxID=139415 RepID=UPI002007709B|nr:cytolysin [Neoantrodia serialis]XP_047889016.1 cytolysin [Neoantrodia serialis]KAH9918484.1 cytolysin [Neoantrodia serialis]KAH9918594.1 cytolysin [Neoantrodia serialis]